MPTVSFAVSYENIRWIVSIAWTGFQPPWIFVVTRWLKVSPESHNFANPPYSEGPSEIEELQDLTWIQHIHTRKGQ